LPLLGYALRPYVRVYPLKPPGSLQSVLSDPEKREMLLMFPRLRIVEGVLSALCYLHHGGFSSGTVGATHG
jgi:hypothetical protein